MSSRVFDDMKFAAFVLDVDGSGGSKRKLEHFLYDGKK